MSGLAADTPPSHLVARYAGRGPRYTSYPPVPTWTNEVGPDQYRTALLQARAASTPIALYVHLPFCAVRCWYCACNVTIQVRSEPVDRYLDRLEREIADVAVLLDGARTVSALHLGGGTPNFLTRTQLQRLFHMLEAHFDFEPGHERAIELDSRLCNKGDVAWLVEHGFHRLSFGIQDLHMTVRRAIGRVMDPVRLTGQFAEAREAGAHSINADLLYGLPHQTSAVNKQLQAIRYRIAFYGYAHVPWLRPQQRMLERSGLPTPEERLGLFMTGLRGLGEHGYLPVGMDHFARPHDPLVAAAENGAMTRNFMGYTTVDAPDLIGLGATSIGFLQSTARPLCTVRGYALTAEDERRAGVIQDILCRGAVHRPDFWNAYPGARDVLVGYEADGLLELEAEGLVVTPMGRLFLRPIAMQFDGVTAADQTRFSATV